MAKKLKPKRAKAERTRARRAKARRAKSKARARSKAAAMSQAPAWPGAPAWPEAPPPEAPDRPGRISVMQISHAALTGTPDGSGPVVAEGLLALHVSHFQKILEYDPSLSRFEMQRRAKALVKDTIEKMLEQGTVESVADGAWEQYEKLVRRGSRDMAAGMFKSPLGALASVARALALRFKIGTAGSRR